MKKLTNNSSRRIAIAIILMCLPLSLAKGQPAAYWNMDFPTSESGPAQQHFLEGVTAMHLHMFEDAQEHFQAAQEIAPDFAMAYWGEALNNHRTIWRIHRRDEAREVLARLAPTAEARAAKAPTAREKAYLHAVELLFGEGTQAERQWAYAEAMRELSEAYPEDMEARAWYALSLMRETPPDRTREQTRSLLASLSLEVLASNPRHPGANRYLIQSTDDPVNTDLGIIAVNNLKMLDLQAAEALHIPSHYYIQHGMWRETAESNMRAFESSMQWVADHDWQLQDLNDHNYGHLLRFANYGFLQSGQLAKAASIRTRVLGDFIASGKAAELAAPLAEVFARHVVDLERWDLALELTSLAEEHNLQQANIWTAIGIAAVRNGNVDLAERALARLGDNGGAASEGAIGSLQVQGLLYLAQGNNQAALDALQQAIEVNTTMNKERPVTLIGIPPRPIKPSHELYGEALLALDRGDEALQAFQTGLTIYQGRTNMLMGALAASLMTGDAGAGERYVRQLHEAWEIADVQHPFKPHLP